MLSVIYQFEVHLKDNRICLVSEQKDHSWIILCTTVRPYRIQQPTISAKGELENDDGLINVVGYAVSTQQSESLGISLIREMEAGRNRMEETRMCTKEL